MDGLHEHVYALIRHVADGELLPRFGRLRADQVREKSPGEMVTDADVAAERALTEGLLDLMPGSVVVGEEASHDDPDFLRKAAEHAQAWLVDPLDGTRHFAAGLPNWGVMVALLERGRVEAAWNHLPVCGRGAYGRRGGGVFLDGQSHELPSAPTEADWRGALHTRLVPEPLKSRIEDDGSLVRTDGLHQSAAQRYVDLIAGREHFALYYRTLPWDHAPGAFLAQEAGAVARQFDRSAFDPTDGRDSLLVAADDRMWDTLHGRLLAGT